MEVSDLDEQSRRGRGERDRSVGAALRLIGSEPAGAILMALGQRPMRTKLLAAQVPDFSTRTIYRCLGSLEDFGLVERKTDGEPPARVPLRLTDPGGRNLFRHLRKLTADSAVARLDGGEWLSWDLLCQLGELWGWGFAGELGRGPRSLVDLLEGTEGLTYHQVRRRACQFVEEGLLESSMLDGCRYYELTDRSRRGMVVIASLGRWRHRHFLVDGTPGLALEEVATLLRAVLPLVTLPEGGGTSIDLAVTGFEDRYGRRRTASLRGIVGEDGTVRLSARLRGNPDGVAAATLNTWLAVLLDGNRGRVRVRGDLELVDDCLIQLHESLWASPG